MFVLIEAMPEDTVQDHGSKMVAFCGLRKFMMYLYRQGFNLDGIIEDILYSLLNQSFHGGMFIDV